MIQTKNFYSNPTTTISRSEEDLFGLGEQPWLSIPWNDITTAGWTNRPDQIRVWGTENQLVMSDQPEFFAPENIIRSNIIPSININDPIYAFDRSQYTYTVSSVI